MRVAISLVLATCLAACGSASSDDAAPTDIAALTYDGATIGNAAAMRAHGERLTKVLGCQSCHEVNLQGGNVTADEPALGKMYAPNLTLLMADYSDAELERAIRRGVAKDGRDMVFMPSEMFRALSDADLAAVIAYLRSVPRGGIAQPPVEIGPAMQAQIAAGDYSNARDMSYKWAGDGPADMGDSFATGAYIARTACAECHNVHLEGFAEFTPDLDIAGAYTPAQLETLLTTGVGKSKRDLGLMTFAARYRFAHLTPPERKALGDYLRARANRTQ